MALKRVTDPINAGYPDYDEHRKSRRRFLKDVASGACAVLGATALTGCNEDKPTAGVPPRPSKPGNPPKGGAKGTNDGPPPKDGESWMGTKTPTKKPVVRTRGRVARPQRLSGEVAPVSNPKGGKVLDGKPVMPQNPNEGLDGGARPVRPATRKPLGGKPRMPQKKAPALPGSMPCPTSVTKPSKLKQLSPKPNPNSQDDD